MVLGRLRCDLMWLLGILFVDACASKDPPTLGEVIELQALVEVVVGSGAGEGTLHADSGDEIIYSRRYLVPAKLARKIHLLLQCVGLLFIVVQRAVLLDRLGTSFLGPLAVHMLLRGAHMAANDDDRLAFLVEQLTLLLTGFVYLRGEVVELLVDGRDDPQPTDGLISALVAVQAAHAVLQPAQEDEDTALAHTTRALHEKDASLHGSQGIDDLLLLRTEAFSHPVQLLLYIGVVYDALQVAEVVDVGETAKIVGEQQLALAVEGVAAEVQVVEGVDGSLHADAGLVLADVALDASELSHGLEHALRVTVVDHVDGVHALDELGLSAEVVT